MFSKVAAATAAGVLAMAGLATSSAYASPSSSSSGWEAKAPSQIISSGAVRLVGGNTSVETNNLDMPVQAGDIVSFRYQLRDGATCSGGAPRVFVETQGVYTNSWDQNIAAGKQCGADGVVTFTVPNNGRIGAAGVVYDNGGAGQVIVSNLTVDGRPVAFRGGDRPRPTTPPVKPKQPWIKQPHCDGSRGTLAIPLQLGVYFKVNGRVWKPGEHQVRPGRYLITAHAKAGGTLVGVHVWKQYVKPGRGCSDDPRPQTPEATPAEPTLTQPTCADKTASLTIPDVEGVVYKTAAGTPLTSGGRYSVSAGVVAVVAEAADGFELAEDAKREWRFTVEETPDCPVSNPRPPVDVDVVNDIPVPTRVDTGLGGLAR